MNPKILNIILETKVHMLEYSFGKIIDIVLNIVGKNNVIVIKRLILILSFLLVLMFKK